MNFHVVRARAEHTARGHVREGSGRSEVGHAELGICRKTRTDDFAKHRPHAALAALTTEQQATITGPHFFPELLSGPFMVGIKIAFTISLLLYLGAALASWFGAARPKTESSVETVPAE